MSKHNNFRKKVQKANQKNKMDEEIAKVQEMQNANDVNPTSLNDGVEVPKPVPVIPPDSPQARTGQLTTEEKEEFWKQLNKLKELVGLMENVIPSDKNHIVDFSVEANRKAFAAAFSPVLIDLLHGLLKARRKEIDDETAAKRVEIEVQGKTIVFENESLEWFAKKFDEIWIYFEQLKRENESWKEYIKNFNENQAEIKKDRENEHKNVTTAYNTLDANMKSYVEQAIEGRKHPLPPPVTPSGDDVGQQFYYLLILLPLYKIRSFLTDRYTLAFFHTAILTVLVVLVSLIGFMAHNEAKLEKDAEKYAIVRSWSYIDDTTPAKDRVRILDALFSDEKNNRLEINNLVSEIRAKYDSQQSKNAKRERK